MIENIHSGHSKERSNPLGSSLIALRNVRLTPRDVAILKAIVDYQLLSTSQIQTLFFRSVHRTRKRLHQLFRAGLLRRISRPVIIGHGQGDLIYMVSTLGYNCLKRLVSAQEMPPRSPSRKPHSFLFLDHLMLRNDFRISLERSAHLRDLKVTVWRQDKGITFHARIISENNQWSTTETAVLPDGLFCLRNGDRDSWYFLEVDRGTAALARIRRKMLAYIHLSLDKQQLAVRGIAQPAVLWLVTSGTRCDKLMAVAENLGYPKTSAVLFLFTNKESFKKNTALGAIWHRPYHPSQLAASLASGYREDCVDP